MTSPSTASPNPYCKGSTPPYIDPEEESTVFSGYCNSVATVISCTTVTLTIAEPMRKKRVMERGLDPGNPTDEQRAGFTRFIAKLDATGPKGLWNEFESIKL